MRVVVGLGNPGKAYEGTRHNVGFAVLDALADAPGTSRFQNRFEALVAELTEGTEKVLLVKPQTYMNLSGRSVRQVLDFYRLEPKDLLVVCDDVHLPLGKLRIRAKGSHGGHNGLRDIQAHLGTQEYPRLRIGVGAAEKESMVGHVLGRFKPSEQAVIQEALQTALQAVVVWITQGVDVCMNRFNADSKEKESEP